MLGKDSAGRQTESDFDSQGDLFCWPPRFVKLVGPVGGFHRRAIESRRKLGEFLGVGRSLIFRDFQRFPWFFGGILATVLALGWPCPGFSC